MEVDSRLEVFAVAEAASHALDLLDLAVEPLAHRVGHGIFVVDQGSNPKKKYFSYTRPFEISVSPTN